jgi:hypothetical protein
MLHTFPQFSKQKIAAIFPTKSRDGEQSPSTQNIGENSLHFGNKGRLADADGKPSNPPIIRHSFPKSTTRPGKSI